MSDFVRLFIWCILFLSYNFVSTFRNKIINHRKLGKYEKENFIYRVVFSCSHCGFFSIQFKEGLFGEFGAENIDALASGEWDKPAHCVGTGTVDCPSTHVKVYFVARHYSLDQSMYG